jgi:ketosteroid isomerase-like protein
LFGWHHAHVADPLVWGKRVVGKEESAVSSAEKNMALARRFMEARVKGDLDALDEMMTPDFVSHSKLLPDQGPDREGQIWATAQFSAAVSNASVHFEDQIVQGVKTFRL